MKEVKGFNGKYLVTTCGRIYATYSTRGIKRLKTKTDTSNGYEMINFTVNKKNSFKNNS